MTQDIEALKAQAVLYANTGLFEQWYSMLTPEEQEAITQWANETIDAITKAFEPFFEATQEAAQALIEFIGELINLPIWENIRRAWLYIKIINRGWPDWIAKLIAYKSPRRWMPMLEGVF